MPNELNNYDSSIQMILGTPPKWIIRWGISIVAIAIFSMLFVSWWVKYPDIISAKIEITTDPSPLEVKAKTSGKVQELFVEDGSFVQKNQSIAVLQPMLIFEDIQCLDSILELASTISKKELIRMKVPKLKQLHDLQSPYSLFIQTLEVYQNFMQKSTELNNIPYLEKDIAYYQSLNEVLIRQNNLLEKEVDLMDSVRNRRQVLLKDGTVSREDLEKAQINLLEYKYKFENNTINILNNKIKVNTTTKVVQDILESAEEKGFNLYTKVEESMYKMYGDLLRWKEKYLITAPTSGRIFFHENRNDQKYLNLGDVYAIIAPDYTKYQGIIKLPPLGVGKIKKGQKVNIKLNEFPKHEFGVLYGQIESFSSLPKHNVYVVRVALPNNLVTSYGQEIKTYQSISGNADIITQDKRLIQRFFNQIMDVFE